MTNTNFTKRTEKKKNTKEKSLFDCFCTVVYFACGLYAYGIAGSLELERIELSEAISALLAAALLCLTLGIIKKSARIFAILRRAYRKQIKAYRIAALKHRESCECKNAKCARTHAHAHCAHITDYGADLQKAV